MIVDAVISVQPLMREVFPVSVNRVSGTISAGERYRRPRAREPIGSFSLGRTTLDGKCDHSNNFFRQSGFLALAAPYRQPQDDTTLYPSEVAPHGGDFEARSSENLAGGRSLSRAELDKSPPAGPQ